MEKDKNLNDNITQILNDPARVTSIIQAGIMEALLKHKQAGNPICGWRDNKVVWIQPEDIVIKHPPDDIIPKS